MSSQRPSTKERGPTAGRFRSAACLVALAWCPWLGGCAGFWDDVTSRDFHVKDWFRKPDPLTVLRESSDGDKRVNALRALREPAQNGGSSDEQDMVLKLLAAASVNERHERCRLAAVQSLGRFQDPRAVEALKLAYERAGTFPPEQATRIRCQTLTALGQAGNADAVDFLVRVVRQPPIDPVKGSEKEKQLALDERIAAARALGNFRQYQATEALLEVLQREKDVALRDRAHESLQAATGKSLPRDAKAWEEFLHRPDAGKSDVQQAGHKVPGAKF